MFDWVYGTSSCYNGIKIAQLLFVVQVSRKWLEATSSNSNYRIMQILLAIQNHVTEKQYYNAMSPIVSYKRTINFQESGSSK
jgi:hypothetical protein